MKWVDTHCHLQLIDETLDSENFHNIEFLIIPGVDFESSLKAKEIVHLYKLIWVNFNFSFFLL